MVQSEFAAILERTKSGAPAYLHRTIGGQEYIRKFVPEPRLIILGGGHIAVPVSKIGTLLEFAVTVVDDRLTFANTLRFPEAEHVICDGFAKAITDLKISRYDFVCVITRGHRYDAECLRTILSGEMPGYLGMIGSKRRVIELLNILEEEGFKRSDLDKIHTPIGIPLPAHTPAEIAVSICAELIQERSALTGKDSMRPLEQTNIDLPTLTYLAENPEDKALLLVIDSTGSTPVKAGSLMAVNRLGQTHGTIGGGCSEGEIMGDARRIIGTGTSRVIEVDMSNDVAAMEGMACGGRMRVLVEDLSNKKE